jgi:Cu/Ag efflux protein CusF
MLAESRETIQTGEEGARKKLALLACSVVVAGLVLAPLTPALAAAKTHDLKATVVSIDLEAKKLTIEDMEGKTKSAPVLDKALETLKTLKAGDKVTVTCQDTEEGEHEGISKITIAES